LIGSFQNFVGEILTDILHFFGIEVGLKLFFTVFADWRWWRGHFEKTVPTQYSCCWGATLTAYHLHITVSGHSESKVLPH